jgi:tetratricopeptide (TPR) repeat protein
VWRALDRPCASVFVPWYLGATRVPEAFQHAPESFNETKKDVLDYHFGAPAEVWIPNLDSSGGVFKLLTNLVDGDYANTIGIVRRRWDALEETAFELQPEVESAALDLYKRDKALAAAFLTACSNGLATRSYETALELIDDLPPSAGGHVQWGIYHYGAGELERAEEDFARALELDPANVQAERCRHWVEDEIAARRSPYDLSEKRMDALAGDYGAERVTDVNGRLYVQLRGGPSYELRPISQDTFDVERYWRYRIRFVTNEDGAVEKLVFYSLDGRSREDDRVR